MPLERKSYFFLSGNMLQQNNSPRLSAPSAPLQPCWLTASGKVQLLLKALGLCCQELCSREFRRRLLVVEIRVRKRSMCTRSMMGTSILKNTLQWIFIVLASPQLVLKKTGRAAKQPGMNWTSHRGFVENNQHGYSALAASVGVQAFWSCRHVLLLCLRWHKRI